MNKLKPFIEEKTFDRSARAFLLLIGVVALAASICSPFLILRFIFALVAYMLLYWIPVWLPSKLLIREQRGTKMGLHPIAWALWQSIYCFVSIIYLKIIEVSGHVAFSSMPFALIVAAGAGYLVSFGEEFILEERLKSSLQKAQYKFTHALMLLLFLCLSSIIGSGLLPASMAICIVKSSLDYAEFGEAIGAALLAWKLLKNTRASI